VGVSWDKATLGFLPVPFFLGLLFLGSLVADFLQR
jgi:hypothetical protein